MKTYTLRVHDEQDEATVMALLTDLLRQKRIELETAAPSEWPGPPPTPEAFAARLQAALDSPVLSLEQARAYLAARR